MDLHVRVLVVEDQPDQATMLARLLQALRCEVETALTGASAIQQAAAFQPHLVLLDLHLPDASGFEVAESILNSCHPQPLLAAVSGFGEPYRSRWQEANLGEYLIKPVAMTDLLELLLKVYCHLEQIEEAEQARLANEGERRA
jgi:CheY-like chemotaxis protein